MSIHEDFNQCQTIVIILCSGWNSNDNVLFGEGYSCLFFSSFLSLQSILDFYLIGRKTKCGWNIVYMCMHGHSPHGACISSTLFFFFLEGKDLIYI